MHTHVWLMRHAQTARPELFHGAESDIDLSALGYRQAEAVAEAVLEFRPEVLISSNMLRARRTAEPIARLTGLTHHIEPSLHERRVGLLAGQPVQGEFGVWPETLREWIAGNTHIAPPEAESYDEIRDRIMPIWWQIVDAWQGKRIVIVAHGIVCRVLLLSLLPGHSPGDWQKFGRIHNVSISELCGSGREWTATRIAEVPEQVRGMG